MKENINKFKCPVCSKILLKMENTFKCESMHTFDISKEGYVNLLLSNQKNSKSPGDNKEMIKARNEFLKKGYYGFLAQKLSEIVNNYLVELSVENATIIDAGCGEGYYIDYIKSKVDNSKHNFIGIDISKEAVKYAAKRNKELSIVAASVFDIPVIDKSADVVISVFAPFKEEEFQRVLSDKGILIIVSPGTHHLFGLKEGLYDSPYLNDEEKLELDFFNKVQKIKISNTVKIENKEDISNLIKMTPYFWNTDMNKIKNYIETTDLLVTDLEFIITIFGNK